MNTVRRLNLYGGRRTERSFNSYYGQMKKKGEKDATIFNTA